MSHSIELIGFTQPLLPDHEARSDMSVAGHGLVDEEGALRVADTIVAESSHVAINRELNH